MEVTLFSSLLVAFNICISFIAAGHALLHKRDPRAALGWVAVSWTFPLAGPLLYFVFGINRVRSKAQRLHKRSGTDHYESHGVSTLFATGGSMDAQDIAPEYRLLQRPGQAVTGMPLVAGNTVHILHNGERAYGRMLAAIASGKDSIYLSTYIFETGPIGLRFIDALADAVRRGVDVRVLLDGMGEFYSLPRAGNLLRERGVAVERFLPPRLLPPQLSVNLRNHRKLLIVDGQVAFTGGMNIGCRHVKDAVTGRRRVTDVHFEFSGPVVIQLHEAFRDDWHFVTRQDVLPHKGAIDTCGDVLCRVIAGGPGRHLDHIVAQIMGVLASAVHSVRIMTPYFLPPSGLISALQAAMLRGVRVDIILPGQSNLPPVHWATRNMLWQLLRFGVHLYYQPPPFAHTKLLLVDGCYAQVGSVNLDPRSLRLNFELNVEIFDMAVTQALVEHFEATRKVSHMITSQELYSRSLPVRMRDAACWLFTPYL